MKVLQNAGYSLKEILAMDAYEMMLGLGMAMYDNDAEEGNENG